MIGAYVQSHIGTLHFGGSVIMQTATEVEIIVCPFAPLVIRVSIANVIWPTDKP